MSWLSISLSNPFKSQESDDEKVVDEDKVVEEAKGGEFDDDDEGFSPVGGVKEDLSEIGKTIGRQLWGVASFLAPPPVDSSKTVDSSQTVDSSSDSSSQTLLGIRNDFAEISGSLKSRLSNLSTNKAVNEISKLASNLLQLQKDDDDEDESDGGDLGDGIVGVSEEVLEFARDLSMRPECWVNFPLSLRHEFDMSDAQREHASNVEHLVPSLAALRVSLCPSHMNEGRFWMIYFILLHPRLNEQDLELLSTSQIAETRKELLEKLKNRTKTQVVQSSKTDDSSIDTSNKGSEVQKKNDPSHEKEVLSESIKTEPHEDIDEQNIDQWLEEEEDDDVEMSASINTQKKLENEEDVSFSDLEEEGDSDASNIQSGLRPIQDAAGVSSPNGSNDWVRLGENSESQGGKKKAVQPGSRNIESEGEESNDWLNVDDFD